MMQKFILRHHALFLYGIIILFLSFIFVFPILLSGNNIGIQDWDQQLAYLESARVSVVNYLQFPFWSPYHCGGMPNFANPQSNIVSITFLLVLVFGTLEGAKISLLIHYFIGAFGFYLLAKHYRLDDISSLLSAVIFAFSGILSSALGVGMISFLAISYIPFVLLFYSKALDVKKYRKLNLLVSSLFLALSFYTGYQIPMIFLPVFLAFVVFKSLEAKNLKPLLNFTTIFMLFLILSLPKLLLSIQLLSSFPRLISDQSGYSLQNLVYFLFYPNQSYINNLPLGSSISYGMDENSLFVGIIPFMFFILGIFYAVKKQKIILAALFASFWLMLGNTIPSLSLWSLLKMLPFYDFSRVAQRFRFDFIIFFALISGFGLSYFIERIPTRFKGAIGTVIIIIVFVNLYLVGNDSFLSKAFVILNPGLKQPTKSFYSLTSFPVDYLYDPSVKLAKNFYYNAAFMPWGTEYTAVRDNIGTIKCYEPIPVLESAKGKEEKGYRGEYYLVANKGRVDIQYWSPNRIVLKVSRISGKDILVLNQNYDSNWSVVTGTRFDRSINYRGLVSFPVDKPSVVIFDYNPFNLNVLPKI